MQWVTRMAINQRRKAFECATKLYLILVLVFLVLGSLSLASADERAIEGRWELRGVVVAPVNPIRLSREGALAFTFAHGNVAIELRGHEVRVSRYTLLSDGGTPVCRILTPQSFDDPFFTPSDETDDRFLSDADMLEDSDLLDDDDILLDDEAEDNSVAIPYSLENGRLYMAIPNANPLLPRPIIGPVDKTQRVVVVLEKEKPVSLDGKWQAIRRARGGTSVPVTESNRSATHVEFVNGNFLLTHDSWILALQCTLDRKASALRLVHSQGPSLPVRVNPRGELELELFELTKNPQESGVVTYFERVSGSQKGR